MLPHGTNASESHWQSLPSMSSSPTVPLVKEKREALKRRVKKDHVQKFRRLSKVDVGQSVFLQQTEGQNWKLGKVTAGSLHLLNK